MTDQNQRARYHVALRILTASLVIGFMAALGLIMSPFWTPLLWAVVLTSTTWPAFTRIRGILPAPAWLAPLLTSLLLGILLLGLLVPLPVQLAFELKEFAAHLKTLDPSRLGDTLQGLPVIGSALADVARTITADPTTLTSIIDEHREAILGFATSVAKGLLSTTVITFATLVGCFGLYRHGETLTGELRLILAHIGGDTIAQLLDTVHATVRGAAYSVLATSVAQGTLAAIGYHVAGAPTPLLLGVLTTLVSLIPFGPPFMYIPVSLYLLFLSGLPWYHGVGLAIWGIVVISTVDNILRPIFISQTTKVSAILVLVGVIGGVTSMGLLGVFIGPAIIAVAQWLWLELARGTPTTFSSSQIP